jgi:sugar phosphate isomerase/epimerase
VAQLLNGWHLGFAGQDLDKLLFGPAPETPLHDAVLEWLKADDCHSAAWFEHSQRRIQAGRCEPGTGEINYPRIAGVLEELAYSGTVGLEAYASEDDELALERFRAAFTTRTAVA